MQLGKALDVVDVGMRRNQALAVGQGKIELADQLDDRLDGVFEPDVDQHPIRTVVDQVDVAAQPLAGLVVHLDDMRKNGLPCEHTDAFVNGAF